MHKPNPFDQRIGASGHAVLNEATYHVGARAMKSSREYPTIFTVYSDSGSPLFLGHGRFELAGLLAQGLAFGAAGCSSPYDAIDTGMNGPLQTLSG